MKHYKIEFAEQAKEDLNVIYAYVQSVSSKENAALVLRRIRKRVEALSLFPERSAPLGNDSDGVSIRIIICGKYRVAYIVSRSDKMVTIVRVLSVGQDFRGPSRDG